jgi:hypothetical protein
VPFFQGLLAEIEAQGDADGALTRIDAFPHRCRGEILLKRDPANTSPAGDALLAIAQQQKARSFELRATLDLARLYNSTSRSADAHALLASALKGLFAQPGISRDRGSANASRRAGVMSQPNERTTCGFGTEPPIQRHGEASTCARRF